MINKPYQVQTSRVTPSQFKEILNPLPENEFHHSNVPGNDSQEDAVDINSPDRDVFEVLHEESSSVLNQKGALNRYREPQTMNAPAPSPLGALNRSFLALWLTLLANRPQLLSATSKQEENIDGHARRHSWRPILVGKTTVSPGVSDDVNFGKEASRARIAEVYRGCTGQWCAGGSGLVDSKFLLSLGEPELL
ncbi:hypothetical protein ElyMa_000170300 [Elysia marginata]|uniref:Uncharacterized protein n=1 Tax=Elysia marginata TaxID=1093978 RepID=A0AAV4ESW2_9GAST|nr:hypothetical protein ElyMa_000170300 [Elysia marginata]